MTVVEVEIDHWRYLTDRAHRRHVHATIRRCVRKNRALEQTIWHEKDGSCCERENWIDTANRMQNALAADGFYVAWAVEIPGGWAIVEPKEE